MAPREGFIVQNAISAGANLDLAEPDALDFNLLGNLRYGVLTGCAVSIASFTITVSSGLAIVNSQICAVSGSVTLPTASQSPRFDLIVVDASGAVSAIIGTADDNPIFPEYGIDVTVLAAVMVRPGITPPSTGDVTDKRIILINRFQAAQNVGSVLSNVDPTTLASRIDIDAEGVIRWAAGDVSLYRSGAGTLRVNNNLYVSQTLSADDGLFGGDVDVTGELHASNFKEGVGIPTIGPVVGNLGDIYKDTSTGSLWLYEGGIWKILATTPIPVGFCMPGFVQTAPPGWLLVNGQTVSRTVAGGLWDAGVGTKVDANNLRLPDAKDCMFGWGTPGVKSGNPLAQLTLTTANLPSHTHLSSPVTTASGGHTHTASMTGAGYHQHNTVSSPGVGQLDSATGSHQHYIQDTGHVHTANADGVQASAQFIVTQYGAQNTLDGYFSDSSHTYAVQPVGNTGRNPTNISINFGGNHVHTTEAAPNHTHGITIDAASGADHSHSFSESPVGGNVPIDIRPPFMGMYLYIKT